ncbi:MAG: hypothetical protein JXA90_08030, partial [Planctomycetes bacterium]|nr:hypothetical protein [Planctomycetota bacterium]
PPCGTDEGSLLVMDVDGNGLLNITDIVYVANALYRGGPPPVLGYGCFAISDTLCGENPGCTP